MYTRWPLQRGVVLKWFYGPLLQRGVVLTWFYSVSRRNTFVGGTCAPPSAFLVGYTLRQVLSVDSSDLDCTVRFSHSTRKHGND